MDPHPLARFVAAQDPVWPRVLAELRAGDKRSHWMWFVFPQIAGLGQSDLARRYAIASLDEARAYLAHPVLGGRLRQAVEALGQSGATDMDCALGGIDAVKLRSSLTLFEAVDPWFGPWLDHWYGGARDPATLARIG